MILVPTPWQTVGPYLHLGLTDSRAVASIAGPEVEGARVSLRLRLFDGDGKPVPDGMFEVWQADAHGRYRNAEDAECNHSADSFLGFGRLPTDENGSCVFETIKPGPVPGPNSQMQAPHLNLGVFGRGLLKRLTTRVYFAGEERNESDPTLALVPANLRDTLMAEPLDGKDGAWGMDIYLCGEKETVFFDL